jgi:predicted ATPase
VTGKSPWPLYLWGSVGTGKTSAALWMLDTFGSPPCTCRVADVIRDWYGGFVRARDMTTLIRADEGKFQAYRHGESWQVTKASLERYLQSAALVVLDDFAVGERPSDYQVERIMDLLDWRAAAVSKPLIVTSNLSPSELRSRTFGGERVADRMLRGSRWQMAGPSRRTGL